nr:UDP-GlcNAc:betaGal beta-1,3-N-acetylglucosaminyltransferase-like protein 1 isoform X13 [Manis javanica]
MRRVCPRTCSSSTTTSGRAAGSYEWTRASSSTATTRTRPHTPSSSMKHSGVQKAEKQPHLRADRDHPPGLSVPRAQSGPSCCPTHLPVGASPASTSCPSHHRPWPAWQPTRGAHGAVPCGPRRHMLLPAFLPSLQRVAVLHPCQPPNCLPPGVGCRPPPETPQCSFGKPVRCLLPRPRTPLPRSRPGGLVLPGDFVAHSSHEALPEPHPAPGTQARKHWLCCPKPASPPSRLRPAGPGTPALRQRGRIWPVPRGRCRELPPWPHAACPRGSGWGVLMALCGVHTSGWRELGTTEKRQSQDRSDPV